MLHCMAFDEVVYSPYSLADDFDVHTNSPLREIIRKLLKLF